MDIPDLEAALKALLRAIPPAVKRLLAEIKQTAQATATHVARLTALGKARWRARMLERHAFDANVDLGRRMAELGIGDADQRGRIACHQESIRNLQTAGAKTSRIAVELEAEEANLAQIEMQRSAPQPPGAEAEYVVAVSACEAFQAQQDKVSLSRAAVRPTNGAQCSANLVLTQGSPWRNRKGPHPFPTIQECPEMSEWYIQIMHEQFGPVPIAELKRLVGVGQVTPDTLVRQGANGAWISADIVAGLFPNLPPRTTTARAPVNPNPPVNPIKDIPAPAPQSPQRTRATATATVQPANVYSHSTTYVVVTDLDINMWRLTLLFIRASFAWLFAFVLLSPLLFIVAKILTEFIKLVIGDNSP